MQKCVVIVSWLKIDIRINHYKHHLFQHYLLLRPSETYLKLVIEKDAGKYLFLIFNLKIKFSIHILAMLHPPIHVKANL